MGSVPAPERVSVKVVVRSWTFSGRANASWLSGGAKPMRKRSSRPFCPLLVGLVLASLPALGSAQSKVWMGKEKDYERFLTNAEIVSVKNVGSGVNEPKRITLRPLKIPCFRFRIPSRGRPHFDGVEVMTRRAGHPYELGAGPRARA